MKPPDGTLAAEQTGTPEPLLLSRRQRSHVLFVLSDAVPGSEQRFLHWYRGHFLQSVSVIGGVLSAQHYEQHELDVTQGRFPRLPLRYLGVYDVYIDGAETAFPLIGEITRLHSLEFSAKAPATWLYYPVCEKVGRAPAVSPSMITLAFANGIQGRESEFREWYATRHVRHALNIPVFVSGQCFERTLFQRPGSLEAGFSTIAVYEQEGEPQAIVDSFATLPEETLDFPSLDLRRFAEWVYRPL